MLPYANKLNLVSTIQWIVLKLMILILNNQKQKQFEFKLNGTADEALKQIEDKGYVRPYEADKRKLFKVGVVFSSETGTISDFKVL